MKSIIVGTCLILLNLCNISNELQAQSSDDDLYIFGFSQIILNSRQLKSSTIPTASLPISTSINSTSTSFALHQVNLFFQKSINEKTTFFLNFEASGSYSSRIPSGEFEVPEGWISFQLNDNIELKTGLLLPKFNNLNEIKNRIPLFPYIIRPVVYETLFDNIFKPEDYKPQSAYVQIIGYKNISDKLIFDYSFYIGNSEDSFLSSVRGSEHVAQEDNATLYRGENLNSELLFGGRFGLENYLNTAKFGISYTIDEDNRTEPVKSVFRLPELTTPILGEIPRYRLGVDLSFTYKKIAFESEYMGVFHDHSEIRKKEAFRNANLNKYFLYSNITYNYNDKIYLFGTASFNSDNTFEFVAPNSPSKAGIQIISGGGGWRINDVTVFKIQFLYSYLPDNDYLDYTFKMLTLGISTIF